RGYASGVGMSVAAVGDADADKAPLQVSQFEADNRLDEALQRFWIEEGGGGTGQESYELAAAYYAGTNCVQLAGGSGRKGYFFFVGDEGFYPTVSSTHLQNVLGLEGADQPTPDAFAALQEKFHTFLIFPAKSMNDRKSDIDAEIRKRVLAAGGQHDDVDIRVSLIWDNRNDLDLHITTPGGEHIFYGHKNSACGGVLDVDRNVRGETITPVENVRWSKGVGPTGDFKVVVRNYGFHEPDKGPTPFRVEMEVGGELYYFEGEIPAGKSGRETDVHVKTFRFEQGANAAEYEAYSDEVVLGQWATVLPAGHVLLVEDPERITDVVVGVLALRNAGAELETYLATLTELGATGINDVRTALSGL
ncbi:MAG: hypothetical protein ACI8RZ_005967, partial [Myxococcota bacterium]